MNPDDAFETLLARLEASGTPYTLHTHVEIRTVADAVALWDKSIERLLKTIGFRTRNGRLVQVSVLAKERVDYKKVAAALDIKRTNLFSLAPDEVATKLGYFVGSVGPLPLADEVTVLLDSHIAQFGQVFFGSGRLDRTFEMRVSDLLDLSRGCEVPLTK